jgi:hypothetical protein
MRDKCLIATLLVVLGAPQASAQSSGSLFGLFGASTSAQTQWPKVPRNEIGCIERGLAQQHTNVQTLSAQGVGPGDPRLAQLRTTCHSQAAKQAAPAVAGQAPAYVVDGLALGARIKQDSAAYREYKCMPSEQFAGFTWCQKQRQDKNRLGTVASSNTILYGEDGTAVYLNRSIAPAKFERGEIDKEIDALSAKYGERARVMRMPATAGVDGTAVIAQWGQIELEPLEADELASLASGAEVPQGLKIDYLGDFTRSAKLGLPVYRIAGGAGYLWTASADPKGRGHLRFLSSNASAYAQAVAPPAGPPVAPPNAIPEVAQVARPDAPEQAATAGAVKSKPDAGEAMQRTGPEAAGTNFDLAKLKAEPGAAATGTAPGTAAGTQPEVTGAMAEAAAAAEQARAAPDGAPAQAEATPGEGNMFWIWFGLGAGLVVIASAASMLLPKRGKAKGTPEPQMRIAELHHALDTDVRMPPDEAATESIATPSHAINFDMAALLASSGTAAERVSDPAHTADPDAEVGIVPGASAAERIADLSSSIDPDAEAAIASSETATEHVVHPPHSIDIEFVDEWAPEPHHVKEVAAHIVPAVHEPASDRAPNPVLQAGATQDADLAVLRCSSCGAGIRLDAGVCSNCGSPVALQS